MIRKIEADELALILPLVNQVQSLHARALPARFHMDGTDDAFLAHFREGLSEKRAIALLDSEGETVRGYLFAYPVELSANAFNREIREMVLDQICVDARFRRQGVARGLIAAMEGEMRTMGLDVWRANHWVFNTASAAMLQSLGAEPNVLVRRKVLSPE